MAGQPPRPGPALGVLTVAAGLALGLTARRHPAANFVYQGTG
jgi:hypothetical protein